MLGASTIIEVDVCWELAPTYEIGSSTFLSFVIRGVARIPCGVQVVIQVFHGNSKLRLVVFRLSLKIANRSLEFHEPLLQVEQHVMAIHDLAPNA
jgi:hypothetical protein